MAIGVVLGGALQLCWQLPSLRNWDISFRPASTGLIPAAGSSCGLMVPAILGNAAVQINVMVNTNFASTIADPGARTMAGELAGLRVPLHAASAGLCSAWRSRSATLPSISRSAAAGIWTNSGGRCRNRWAWCSC
jgi:putative peptidoglycan lipid II flippase